jgi:transposase-like protein
VELTALEGSDTTWKEKDDLGNKIVDMREARGKAIAEVGGVKRISSDWYQVASQSGKGRYDVHLAESGWTCSCPDHFYREVKCKHIFATEYSRKLREKVRENVIIEPIEINACIFCESSRLKKYGIRHNKQGDIQRFLCADCGRTFSVNIGFERMKHSPQGITTAMQLYFSGESLRNTAKSLRLLGVQVTHQTVYNWIQKYVRLMDKYLEQIKPQVSETWRADEMFLKIKGNAKYLYALLDDETRYWIAKEVAGDKMSHEAVDYASRLFQQGKEITGKRPRTLITDGLNAYHLAWKREFWTLKDPRTHHVTWEDGKVDNRKTESFNGNTVRVREKVMRSLKREDTPILTGMRIFHNYLRPNQGIGDQTPSQLAGIQVNGENKWMTLIQNASRRQPRFDRSRQQP